MGYVINNQIKHQKRLTFHQNFYLSIYLSIQKLLKKKTSI